MLFSCPVLGRMLDETIMVPRDVIMVVTIRTAVIIIVSRESDSRDYDSLTIVSLTAVVMIV